MDWSRRAAAEPELAADSFGRMHFGPPPHGFDTGAGPAPPPGR